METSTTTTKTNLQVVQQGFNDFSKGNIKGIIDACDDQVEWGGYKNPDIPIAGMFHGKEGVQEFFAGLADLIDYNSFEPKEFITQGDTVMVLGHHVGTVKNTGKKFDHDWCMEFKLRNGKIVRFFSYVDSLDQAKAFKE